MLVGIIWGILRGMKSSLSLYAMIEEEISGKKAVEESINLIKGNFGKVFKYISLMSIVSSSIGYIIQKIFNLLSTYSSALSVIFGVMTVFLSGIIFATSIVFLNKLYIELKISQGTAPLNPHTAQANP
jgi:hypothetical protein